MRTVDRDSGTLKARHWDRPVVPDSTFGFATGRIRMRENNLMSHEELMRLAEPSATAQDWTNQLNASGYPQAESLRARLDAMAVQNDRFLREVAGQTPLARALLLEYDYHHVKVMLKTWLLATREAARHGEDRNDLRELLLTHRHLMHEEAPTPVETLATWLAAQLAKLTPPVSLEEDLERYLTKVLELLPADAAIASVDRRLDRAYYEHMLELAHHPDARGMKDLILDDLAIRADSANIQSLYRIRKVHGNADDLKLEWMPGGLIPYTVLAEHFYESEPSIAEAIRQSQTLVEGLAVETGIADAEGWGDFGKRRDNYRIRLASKNIETPFGAEVPYAYWLGRREEIKNLRLLMAAQDRQMTMDEKAALLRRDYRSRSGWMD